MVMRDHVGDNTTRGQRKMASNWLLNVALFVLGFALFTLIFWSV